MTQPVGERVAALEERIRHVHDSVTDLHSKADAMLAELRKMNGSQVRQDEQLRELTENDAALCEELRPLVEDYRNRNAVNRWMGGAWGTAVKFIGVVGTTIGIPKATERI